MIYFSIPSDFKKETLNKIHEFNQNCKGFRIDEVYGQLTVGEILSSGRIVHDLPRANINMLRNYIGLCSKYNIDFNYTLNSSCMGNLELTLEGRRQLREFVTSLTQIGITSFTVAIPTLMDYLLGLDSNIKIKASAICEINCLEKANFYFSKGIRRMVLDTDINKNFNQLRMICAKYNEVVELIVNSMCIRKCPYKLFHYNHDAHCSKSDDANKVQSHYYFHLCSLQKANRFYNYIRVNWIRPEDLHYYYELGIKRFKIQGRGYASGNNILRAVQIYSKERFDGNLIDLLTNFTPYNAFQPTIDNRSLDGYLGQFYENEYFCTDNCEECRYCINFAEKSMDMEKSLLLSQRAKEFYELNNEFDS